MLRKGPRAQGLPSLEAMAGLVERAGSPNELLGTKPRPLKVNPVGGVLVLTWELLGVPLRARSRSRVRDQLAGWILNHLFRYSSLLRW